MLFEESVRFGRVFGMADSFEGYVKFFVENPNLTQPPVTSIHGVTLNPTQYRAWFKARKILKEKEFEEVLDWKRKVKAKAKEVVMNL